MKRASLLVGIDIGSTTVKVVVWESEGRKLLFSTYQRHYSSQIDTLRSILEELFPRFDAPLQFAICGSGGLEIAQALRVPYVQEVVANSFAIKEFYPETSVAIELGGQDAKVIFFRKEGDRLVTHDMRMNGSCAGGTGAFLEQIAEILHIPLGEFNSYAERGTHVYEISGRCGVFAKTDIQPLLNQGVSKEDIALSAFHAIAKQTIGGLAQGMTITPPVIFEGGPLTFNPVLVRVFQERLHLEDHQIILPQHPELIVALGAALALLKLPKETKESLGNNSPSWDIFRNALDSLKERNAYRLEEESVPFFTSEEEREEFQRTYGFQDFIPPTIPPGTTLKGYIGIDAGSTTSKFVLMDEQGKLINAFYSNNQGDPLRVIHQGLILLRDTYRNQGVDLQILGAGTTGYGEVLFAKAFDADYHTVETVAHAEAALSVDPKVSFILDIGGQDMKAIYIQNGIITGITLNEACSAGCGSFLETYAASLGVPVHQIATLAFESKHPSRLGSRCTVFMNSSIITEQKNGKSLEDILAGLCRSIIDNVFTKVIRTSNLNAIGNRILVQGGTFRNDAVFRALQLYTGKSVTRAPYPGLMGAMGIALLTKRFVEQKIRSEGSYRSRFIPLETLEHFSYTKEPSSICPFCMNACNRSILRFSNGKYFVTGNRCERGEILEGKPPPRSIIPDMVRRHEELLLSDYKPRILSEPRKCRIGIPRVLEFYESLPYWKALFTSLGFQVVLSRRSSYPLFEAGLKNVPSDTVCFPAKLGHGHVLDLVAQGVDRIFWPMMIRIPKKNPTAQGGEMCPIVQGYPMVVDKSDEPFSRYGVPFDHPTFHWYDRDLKHEQTIHYIKQTYSIPESFIEMAIQEAEIAHSRFRNQMERETEQILHRYTNPSVDKDPNSFAVIISGRPYHADPLIHHGLTSLFTSQGIPVLSALFLPRLSEIDLQSVRMETYNPYHTRMLEAALFAARHPNLELVQLVSFGCGHDAIISDEMARILKETSGKELLVLKLDEGEARGPLNIRIKSFVETIRAKRRNRIQKGEPVNNFKPLSPPFPVQYLKSDRKRRTILIPNLSPAFSYMTGRILEEQGFSVKVLDVADRNAIELGKRYVHNDICFPAQVNIGEILAELQRGHLHPKEVVAGLAKNCVACRAGQYAALCRKALDEAGYPEVPIITTGTEDDKQMHPGFRFSIGARYKLLWGLRMVDALETMLRRIRPYETTQGTSDRLFQLHLKRIADSLPKGTKQGLHALEDAVEDFNCIPLRSIPRKPRVGIVGEILMNYHPGANRFIEAYLERNGMEIVLPGMIEFFRKGNIAERHMAFRRLHPHPVFLSMKVELLEWIFGKAHDAVVHVMERFKYGEEPYSIKEISQNTLDLIDPTYQIGEGWLMPGEIIQLAKMGIHSFVILNPFGCMPNHITGRGMIKTLKTLFPQIQILSLDFDPDTSFANIENRLQMLILTAMELEERNRKPYSQPITLS
ncbi:MAG: acyl-CoA dehydratase activase [Spirochaetes bacterium]|nr:acyl-CoA dehydratase activase [Spirochaetota bacterium]